MRFLFYLIVFFNIVFCDNFYYNKDEKIFLKKIENISTRSISNYDYFEDNNGNLLAIENTLVVKFKTTNNLELYKSEFNLILLKEIFNNTYLFKLKNNNDILSISNQLHERDDIEYSQPNFIRFRQKR